MSYKEVSSHALANTFHFASHIPGPSTVKSSMLLQCRNTMRKYPTSLSTQTYSTGSNSAKDDDQKSTGSNLAKDDDQKGTGSDLAEDDDQKGVSVQEARSCSKAYQ